MFNLFSFNKKDEEILPPTQLSLESQKQFQDKLKITLCGGTDIHASLNSIVAKILKQKRDTTLKEVVVILTDGDDKIEGKDFTAIHETLASLKAETFAIGIGAEHKKENLLKIVTNEKNYIDASKGGDTIKEGIEKIYNQAIVASCPVTLTSSDLTSEQVKVDGQPCPQKDGPLHYELGQVNAGEPLARQIKINRKGLKAPVDLSKVSLQLHIPVSGGQVEEIPLKWSPSPIMDPAILNR
jgi:hypothetical protein